MSYMDYWAYLNKATFFNATGRTLQDLLTRVFRRPAVTNVPAQLNLDEVYQDGRTFLRGLRDTTKEVLTANQYGILLDMPAVKQTTPQVQAIEYLAEQIISWSYGKDKSGKTVLTSVLLLEHVPDESALNIFEGLLKDRCRMLALDPVTGEYFQYEASAEYFNTMKLLPAETDEKKVYPTIRGQRLKYIPFYFFGIDHGATVPSKPLLLDIAHLNIAHYQDSATLTMARHYVGSPIYVAKYANPTLDPSVNVEEDDGFVLSSSYIWEMGPEDSAEILEFQGTGLSSLENARIELEEHMRILGASIVTSPKNSPARSGSSEVQESESHEATLLDVVESVSRTWEVVLGVICQWRGLSTSGIKVQLNKQFGSMVLGSRDLRAVDAALGRSLPPEALFFILMEGGWLPADMSQETYLKEVQKYIDAEQAANFPVPGGDGGPIIPIAGSVDTPPPVNPNAPRIAPPGTTPAAPQRGPRKTPAVKTPVVKRIP